MNGQLNFHLLTTTIVTTIDTELDPAQQYAAWLLKEKLAA